MPEPAIDRNRRDTRPPKPPWLKVRLGQGPRFAHVAQLVRTEQLHTVCEEALCPNRGKCWEHGRATLMILGDTCSRACRFCNVSSARPSSLDTGEPARVAEAVARMQLSDVVITSVTRDDLPDGGAAIWAETIRRIHDTAPGVRIEVLIPDFGGSENALLQVLEAGPDVLGHNLETVPSLYDDVRPGADYDRSKRVLSIAHTRGFITKTALMLGLGESRDEVLSVMHDARLIGCEIFYLGQYLQPSGRHAPVRRYVEPSEFEDYRRQGLAMGFPVVVSAPLVRSSFHADEQEQYVRGALAKKQA